MVERNEVEYIKSDKLMLDNDVRLHHNYFIMLYYFLDDVP